MLPTNGISSCGHRQEVRGAATDNRISRLGGGGCDGGMYCTSWHTSIARTTHQQRQRPDPIRFAYLPRGSGGVAAAAAIAAAACFSFQFSSPQTHHRRASYQQHVVGRTSATQDELSFPSFFSLSLHLEIMCQLGPTQTEPAAEDRCSDRTRCSDLAHRTQASAAESVSTRIGKGFCRKNG